MSLNGAVAIAFTLTDAAADAGLKWKNAAPV